MVLVKKTIKQCQTLTQTDFSYFSYYFALSCKTIIMPCLIEYAVAAAAVFTIFPTVVGTMKNKFFYSFIPHLPLILMVDYLDRRDSVHQAMIHR